MSKITEWFFELAGITPEKLAEFSSAERGILEILPVLSIIAIILGLVLFLSNTKQEDKQEKIIELTAIDKEIAEIRKLQSTRK